MDYTYLFIVGVVVVTGSLMLNYVKRRRLDAERQTKRRAVAVAAREAERKRQLQSNEPVKIKPEKSYASGSDRIPATDPLSKPFSGSFTPRNVAQWELEIDKIGRQWAGTLDSKMVALQTITQEASRAANRMELLLEQFERIVQFRAELSAKIPQTEPPTESQPESLPMEPLRPYVAKELTEDLPKNSSGYSPKHSSQKQPEEPQTESPDEIRRFIPAGESELQAAPLVLDELEAEIDRLQQQIANEALEQNTHATILKIDNPVPMESPEQAEPEIEQPETEPVDLRPSPAHSVQDHYAKPAYPLDSTASNSAGTRRISVTPSMAMAPMGNLSFESLYNDKQAKRKSDTGSKSLLSDSARLDLQRQVEMLHNYGYTPRQIAQSLNITVGEVDLMQNLGRE